MNRSFAMSAFLLLFACQIFGCRAEDESGPPSSPAPKADAGTAAEASVEDASSEPPIESGIADGGGGDAEMPERDGGQPVRILAGNISSGSNQTYEEPGIRLLRGLAPDVALLQEMKVTGSIREFVDTAFGTQFQVFVDPRGDGLPNGVVSRFPILAGGVWDDTNSTDRDFTWAHIDLPGPTDLWVVSLHLLTRNATVRNAEATELASYVSANVPAGDYLVIGGDTNADNRGEAVWSTFGGMVVVAPPFPSDQQGTEGTNASRSRPYDCVLARANLNAREVPLTAGATSFAHGLVFDSRVFTPLTAVAPIQIGDSAVTGMQHMPVIRAFSL